MLGPPGHGLWILGYFAAGVGATPAGASGWLRGQLDMGFRGRFRFGQQQADMGIK